MRILIIGQTTLHWGRMEFGNIGNYYIIEPFIRELHRVFPGVIIKTTLQMSDAFCIREKVSRLPMELYYSWDDPEFLSKIIKELGVAELYNKTGTLIEITPYIKEVKEVDLVIDFSGDIWGDNANLLGENRFLIGLIKDRIAQLLNKKTVMLAGSPGPFSNEKTKKFAKIVYENFDLVTNREEISTELLKKHGFNLEKTKSLACPAFLFEPKVTKTVEFSFKKLKIEEKTKKVGFILCGWNLLKGPFDRWPIEEKEVMNYVVLLEKFIYERNVTVILLSHSNGFDLPPYFKLKHGRDYPLVKLIYNIIVKRKKIDLSKVKLQEEVLVPWEIKAFIGKLDMLISGRVHGAVASLSQNIPTVIIDYGHEPKAHKLVGFARVIGMEDMVVAPSNNENLMKKVIYCYDNLKLIKEKLRINIKEVKNKARNNFNLLKQIVKE